MFAQTEDRVSQVLAALDYGADTAGDYSADIHDFDGEVEAVPPSVRRVAALLGCSVEAASYIDALETRVAALEGKVAELRHDVRKVRRAA